MFRRAIFFLFFLLSATLNASTSLKERVLNGKEGDYIVMLIDKTYTLLHLHTQTDKHVSLEEISIPSLCIKEPFNWTQWVKDGMPNSNQHLLITFDKKKFHVVKTFSVLQNTHVTPDQTDSLLQKLSHLPLTKLAASAMKKIGPAPLNGEIDRRRTWYPPLVFNGHTIATKSVSAFSCKWPNDNSELSSKTIQLYFHTNAPFPYWIEVSGGHYAYKMRSVASGSGLISQVCAIPKIAPCFTSCLESCPSNEQHIILPVTLSPDFDDYTLLLVDTNVCTNTPVEITYTSNNNGAFVVNKERIKAVMKPGHSYTWALCPTNDMTYLTQSQSSFNLSTL